MPKSVSLSVPSARIMRLDGFKIAMDDALLVGVLQGGAELLAERDDFFPGHPAAPGHDVIERFALDVLHGVSSGVPWYLPVP